MDYGFLHDGLSSRLFDGLDFIDIFAICVGRDVSDGQTPLVDGFVTQNINIVDYQLVDVHFVDPT